MFPFAPEPVSARQFKNIIRRDQLSFKIILTNDDGIDAPGLDTLARSVQEMGEVVIVAPSMPQSGVAHRVTTHSSIDVRQIDRNLYSVNGTPADCTRVALKVLASDADWLIAGINPGANLGSDVYQSGTVAAAREAAILGCPSIAISQYIAKEHEIDWRITGHHAALVIKMLLLRQPAPGHFWNVNLPHPLEYGSQLTYIYCGLDTNPHKYEYRKNADGYTYKGVIHERPRDAGKDVAVCFDQGEVSITRIALGTTGLE